MRESDATKGAEILRLPALDDVNGLAAVSLGHILAEQLSVHWRLATDDDDWLVLVRQALVRAGLMESMDDIAGEGEAMRLAFVALETFSTSSSPGFS